MSDFLTNLAARVLHAAPVVQPRLASRFEAAPAGDRVRQDDSFGGEAESFHESAAPSPPPATIARSAPHVRASATQSDSDMSPLQSLPLPEQTVANALTPRETHAEITSPINSLSTREQPVANELPRASSPGESHIAAASPIVVQTVIERPALRDHVLRYDARESVGSRMLDPLAVSRHAAENALDRRSILDALEVEKQPIAVSPLRPESASQVAVKTTPSSPLVAFPRLTPAPAPAQHLDRPAAAPDPAPTIRVTIGRVEVRAILPPAPPRGTPTRAAPLLTLDEYLKQRTEGRK